MKRLAAILVIMILGTLPAAAENVTTYPVRGATLDLMVREILEWLNERTEYSVSSAPNIVFLDNFNVAIAEHERRREESVDVGFKFRGSYNHHSKTVYLRNDWNGHARKDWVVLVHELVHHAQVEARKRFECLEDEELEAIVLSVNFLNHKFGDPLPHMAGKIRTAREEQTTCAPPSELPATTN